jgi:glycosyltransferase involved in cell wall biosynthesis
VEPAVSEIANGADVLHLSWSGHVGGIERMLAILLREAQARSPLRHRACFLDGAGAIGETLAREGLACRLAMRHGADFAGLWRLRRVLRETRPRVVHLHTVALGAVTVALRATPSTFVYTEHFPRVVARPLRHRLLYAMLRRRGVKGVAFTPGLVRSMVDCGLPAERIAMVPNPCAVPLLAEARPAGDPPVVGCVTRLVEAARVDALIEVVAELRRGGSTCKLLVVGDGPARPALERAAESRLGPGVATFAGEQADVAPWLDRMDLFLLTREVAVFSLAIVEAMARRVPVAALACRGGSAEVVAEAGLLLPDRDVPSAAAALARLFAAPAERQRLEERGASLAAGLAPAAILARLEAVYLDGARGAMEREIPA